MGKQPLSIYQIMCIPAMPPDHEGVPMLDGLRMPHIIGMGKNVAQIAGIFDRIIRSLLENRPGWQLETRAAILELFHKAMTINLPNSTSSSQAQGNWGRLLARIERERDIPSVEELAAEFSLSPQHFIRCFKQLTGKSPKRYML
ncbi:MAG: AraC family transcriptional regulator, partial [Planctomycetes bacterium]|nr:AraC family transcriptional regulator [Planctomycetota bacterium]